MSGVKWRFVEKECIHGVDNTEVNCLLCFPEKTNKCTCGYKGECKLCNVFKPICKKIDKCCKDIHKGIM